MKPLLELTGKTFFRWHVLHRGENDSTKHSRWWCRCDCGTERLVLGKDLVDGKTTSCGCRRNELASERASLRNWRHGLGYTDIATCWYDMLDRCYNPNKKGYARYGGRGIRVCEALRSTPLNLLLLLGDRPQDASIDRINNDAHYSCGKCAECLRCDYPKNVRWASARTQARNMSTNRLATICGVTKTAVEWSEVLGMKYRTLLYRLNHGIDPISPPLKVRKAVLLA